MHESKKVWVELGADGNAGGMGIRVLGGGRQGERDRGREGGWEEALVKWQPDVTWELMAWEGWQV